MKLVKPGKRRPKKIVSQEMHGKGGGREVPYSDELPGFFKIYVPEICSEKMMIPPEFTKKFDRKMPTVVTLIGSNGDFWQVDVNKINGNRYFQKDWPKFVQENSLEYGDFMTFSYDDKSVFYVEVYATNGCPKSDLIENSVQEDEASKLENLNHSQNSQRNLRPTMSSIARTYPFFKVDMTESYTRRREMHLPQSFVNLYIGTRPCRGRTVTLQIKHKSWLVSLITSACDKVSFTKGWPKFKKDNSLKNGHKCTFELIDENELVFEVDIRR